jgi:hypothetical protein
MMCLKDFPNPFSSLWGTCFPPGALDACSLNQPHRFSHADRCSACTIIAVSADGVQPSPRAAASFAAAA